MVKQTKVAEQAAEALTRIQEQSQAVSTVSSTALAEPFLTDDMFEDYANAGHENVTAADLIIPRITLLQALSPQINPKKGEFIEGAQVGDICDVGMGELISDPMWFLPVYYSKAWLEWAPRSGGGGLVAIHKTSDILKKTLLNDRKQSVLPNGNLISETAQFFGLNLSKGGRESFLPMTSTQLKKAKKWVTHTTSQKSHRKDGTEFSLPMWYRTYKLGTIEEGNQQGDWVGWTITPDIALRECGDDAPALLQRAIKLYEVLRRGEITSDADAQQADEADHDQAAKAA